MEFWQLFLKIHAPFYKLKKTPHAQWLTHNAIFATPLKKQKNGSSIVTLVLKNF
jgi:hypothetical protein